MERDETGGGIVGSLATLLARKGRRAWPLTVVDKTTLSPHMLRVRFQGSALNELEWKRGQDLVLEIPAASGVARRHYTIRNFDPVARTLDIDFVLHGASTTADWLSRTDAGAELIAVGPRGHTYIREGDWHLFVGDETAIPAIFAMLEGLPHGARAHAVLEIGSDEDKIPFQAQAHVLIDWVSRNGAPPGPGRLLYDRVERFRFPPGEGHAYVIGETANVRAIRHRLIERGLAKNRIAAEGYWRPGRIGGHDHV
jgi:NADPH-dependent ferric siderophore reductase